MIPRLLPFSLLFLVACTSYPPKTIRLPAALSEASGLSIQDSLFFWHNDSGDGPFLYTTNIAGKVINKDSLPVPASDWEDMAYDGNGHYYLGDFGNNLGQRKEMAIYRFTPKTRVTEAIYFTYPGQNGEGRNIAGNYDCEALVHQNYYLHLFTKDQLFGERRFITYHYRVPDEPGTYVAELIDSLYLPRRVVTAAALDTVSDELILTAYSFQKTVGVPNGSASLITITDYPEGRFLRGKVKRRNLSWLWPTQFEAVDIFNQRWLYVVSEATKLRKQAVAKRKRRR
ncbi:MAG: hypothetical protein AAGF89_15300 [Bacteroidota bacterium]